MRPEDFSASASGRLTRTPEGYWAFVPHPLPPEISWSPALAAALSAADRAVGELAGLGRVVPEPYLLIGPFVRREAVLSSRIEGTRASLTDVYAWEAMQLKLWNDRDAEDVREVFNYVRALEHGLRRLADLLVSLRLLRELHAILLEGVRGGSRAAGEFRKGQNWIGPPGCTPQEATYVPPPANELPAALDAFEKYLHEESALPPLVRLALIHYQFEAIHPFFDGNGRLGRMLVVLLLCAWGLLPQPLLYLSAFFEAHRREYYDRLLEVSTRGAWEEWLLFFLRGVESQARDAAERAARLLELRRRYRERFQKPRASAVLRGLVDLLFKCPVITVPLAAKELGVTYAAAARHVERLVRAGVLREAKWGRGEGRRRNRMFIAEEVLAAVEGPLDSGT